MWRDEKKNPGNLESSSIGLQDALFQYDIDLSSNIASSNIAYSPVQSLAGSTSTWRCYLFTISHPHILGTKSDNIPKSSNEYKNQHKLYKLSTCKACSNVTLKQTA